MPEKCAINYINFSLDVWILCSYDAIETNSIEKKLKRMATVIYSSILFVYYYVTAIEFRALDFGYQIKYRKPS